MRRIPLSQGQFALVDDEDYDWLMRWKWFAVQTNCGFRAARGRQLKDAFGPHLIFMTREIMRASKNEQVDHTNHNTLDNQKYNLRPCTHAQNGQNMKSQRGSSQYKGVVWSKRNKKWKAQIVCTGKLITLGFYNNEEEAAKAYDKAARTHFGEFAHTNFPEKGDVTCYCQ